jgi:uncharacterized protein (DUF433 family)
VSTAIDRSHAPQELAESDPRAEYALYTLAETAQYLGVPYSTLQTWVRPAGERVPLVTSLPREGYEASIPFIGFAEAFVLQAVRRAGVPRNRIRPGVEAVRTELGIEHALASQRLYTDGAELLVRYTGGEELEVARNRQRQLSETVRNQLELITYGGDGYAARIHLPDYGPAEVIVDPAVAFGAPVMLTSGARVQDLVDRFWAGESVGAIAADFDMGTDKVEAVIRAQTKPTN